LKLLKVKEAGSHMVKMVRIVGLIK
jgi:hypothetical protein